MPQKAKNAPKYLKDFSSPKRMGHGKSSSTRVQDSAGNFYQLKEPIAGQAITKKIRAGNTDKENVGELASACIVNAFIKPEEAHLYPDVLAFYHYKNATSKKSKEEKNVALPTYHEKSIYIASKYLQGDKDGVRNLDEYVFQQLGLPPDTKGHAKFFSGSKSDATTKEVGINAPMMKNLLPSFCRALVVSAILGDHDVNPGNLMVVTQDGVTQIGRIDYGHAFNDLINTKEIFGGGLRDQLHPVKDFLNRANVGGINIFTQGSDSKLWRDYQGLVFTHGMADALMEAQAITDDQIRAGVHEFMQRLGLTPGTPDRYGYVDGVPATIAGDPGGILFQMDGAKFGSKEAQLKLLNTLQGLYTGITGKTLEVPKGSPSDQVVTALAKVGEAMARFIGKNRDDAVLTGRLMKAQLAIRAMVENGFTNTEINAELERLNILPLDKCFLMRVTKSPEDFSARELEQFKGSATYVIYNDIMYYINIDAEARRLPLVTNVANLIHHFPKGDDVRQIASESALMDIAKETGHKHPTIWIIKDANEEPFIGTIQDYVRNCRKEYCGRLNLQVASTPNLKLLYQAELQILSRIKEHFTKTIADVATSDLEKSNARFIWRNTQALLDAVSDANVWDATAIIADLKKGMFFSRNTGFFTDVDPKAKTLLDELDTELKALLKSIDKVALAEEKKPQRYLQKADTLYSPRVSSKSSNESKTSSLDDDVMPPPPPLEAEFDPLSQELPQDFGLHYTIASESATESKETPPLGDDMPAVAIGFYSPKKGSEVHETKKALNLDEDWPPPPPPEEDEEDEKPVVFKVPGK